MSLSFDGANDVVTSGATQTWGNDITVCAWIKTTSQGENNRGTIWSHGTRLYLSWNASAASKKLQIFTDWSGNNGTWDMTTGFADITPWIFVAAAFPSINNASSDPILYTLVGSTFSALAVGSGLTEVVTPTGSIAADNQTVRIGDDPGSGQCVNGLIAEAAQWKRALSAAELAAVATVGVNAAPDHFNYLPLDDGRVQNLGASGGTFTITSAVAGENPPVRPCGRTG